MSEAATTSPAADPQRTGWAKVLLLWLCGVGAGLQFAKASVGFDALAAHYHADPTLAGWLLSTVGVVGIVFGATAGLIVESAGFRRSLVAGLAAATALSLIQTTLPPVPVFLVSRVLEGGAHLAIIVAAPSLLPRVVAPGRRAIVIGLWGTFFSVAFLFAGVFGLPLLNAYGVRALFGAHALIAAVLALSARAFIPADLPRVTRAPHAARHSLISAHIEVYADLRTSIPALCFLCYTGMYLALQTLTPELVAPGERAWLTVGMPFVSVTTTLFAAALAQGGLSPFRLAAGAFAAAALASSLLHLAIALGFGVVPLGLGRMAFVSLLPGAVYPMIPLLCRTPPLQARAYGAIAQLGNVGSTLGPPLFAASLSLAGPLGMLAPTLALSVGGAAIALWAGHRFAAASQKATPLRAPS